MIFTVRCGEQLAGALTELVAEGKAAEQTWWEAKRDAIDADATTAQRARLLDAAQAEFAALRAAGQMRGTRAALIVPALEAELAERRWLGRRWRPVPPGAASRAGRRWGTPDQKWRRRFVVDVPDRLGEVLVRATWWTSAPAVRDLQAWYDEFGDNWRGRLHDGRRWTGAGPSNTDLGRRAQLVERIVTTPEVLRCAAARATGLDPHL